LRRLQFFHISGFAAAAGFAVLFAAVYALGADFRPPIDERSPLIASSGTILPGGRVLRPLGTEIETGPAPFALAVGHNGTIATADTGFERFGITIVEPPGKSAGQKGLWQERHIWARTPNTTLPEKADPDWKSVSDGIALDDAAKAVWVSEGDSGRIRQLDLNSGETRKVITLNSADWRNSVTGDIAWDSGRRLLYVVDQTNSRIALVDARAGHVVSSVSAGRQPFAIALSPDAATAYVTNADSVCIIDVRDIHKPELTDCVKTDSPQGLAVIADRVFVSNARSDSITVIGTADRRIVAEIPLQVPSLEPYRGIAPAGMAWDPVTKWLLVAEEGINALGIVDTERNLLIGHIPAGWMPTRVAISGDRVYVTNALGRGTGPTPYRPILALGEVATLHRGMVTTFIMPDESEVLRHTGTVFVNNGFVPWMRDPPTPPAAIKHVVLIVKSGRTFDEVLGDIAPTGDSKEPPFNRLTRFGMHGAAFGGKGRFSVQDAAITPNHHAVARQWAFSDNFYVDGEREADGDWWLDGGYPDLLTARGGERPGDGPLWNHLETSGVTFRKFDDPDGPDGASDQKRADRFIAGVESRYRKGGEPFPQFTYIRLPNDHLHEARPAEGYPYEASWMEDNDLALGRILEYLSHSPWWPDMAVFVTESGTEGGLDHIDSHRTVLLAAGPYVKRNYVSHTNSNFPGLLRTIFELLHAKPLNLMDATAASLRGMLTDKPDFTPFSALAPDPRIFTPEAGK
jgi:DNA-binding beta-propeller fold protein YncE